MGNWTSLLLTLGVVTGAAAQTVHGDVERIALGWAQEAAQRDQANAATPLRLEISVGALDARLKLAPCANMEPYLPVGSKLWGKSRIAVRCIDGMTRWNVSVPVTINAWGQAWVVRGQVAAGATLTQEDAIQAQVNWAQEPSAVLNEPGQWVGQTVTRPLSTGQTLRMDLVRPTQVFSAGAQVKVFAQGPGFQIASDGQALSAGVVGQTARVRMDSGRVASGVVLDTKTVKIDL